MSRQPQMKLRKFGQRVKTIDANESEESVFTVAEDTTKDTMVSRLTEFRKV